NGTTPTVGGEKPHISIHADLPALQSVAGGLHETEDADIIDVDTLRMIACDCSITRIVLGPDSEIVDVGRKTRVWTSAQRRVIVARDRHCQGPGCRARPRSCDIHHRTHWADGGETTIDNGVLLCRPCHTLEHLEDKHRRRWRART
ncbi:MAG: HNH endonuclease, partial [Acidimicrobiia bacterium]